MKKQRNQRGFKLEMSRLWLLLLVLWIALIFGHSLTPAELSSKESGWVMDCLLKLLGCSEVKEAGLRDTLSARVHILRSILSSVCC